VCLLYLFSYYYIFYSCGQVDNKIICIRILLQYCNFLNVVNPCFLSEPRRGSSSS
jgi:hypothetical protein